MANSTLDPRQAPEEHDLLPELTHSEDREPAGELSEWDDTQSSLINSLRDPSDPNYQPAAEPGATIKERVETVQEQIQSVRERFDPTARAPKQPNPANPNSGAIQNGRGQELGAKMGNRQLSAPGNQLAAAPEGNVQGVKLFRDGVQPKAADSAFKQPALTPQGGAKMNELGSGSLQERAMGAFKNLRKKKEGAEGGDKAGASKDGKGGESLQDKAVSIAERAKSLATTVEAGARVFEGDLTQIGALLKGLWENRDLLIKAYKAYVAIYLGCLAVVSISLAYILFLIFQPSLGPEVPAYSGLPNPTGLSVPESFSPEMIMSDEMLTTNTTFPDAAAIDSYLKAKGSILSGIDISRLGTIPSECAGSKTAGDIIWCATRGVHSLPPGAKDKNDEIKQGPLTVSLNPMVILAWIHKEQALLLPESKIKNPQGSLDCAMGYNCRRDSGPSKSWPWDKGFAANVVYGSMNVQSIFNMYGPGKPGEQFKVGKSYDLDYQHFRIANIATAVLYDFNPEVGLPSPTSKDPYGNYNLWLSLRDPLFRGAAEAMGVAKATGQKAVFTSTWKTGGGPGPKGSWVSTSSYPGQDGVTVYKQGDYANVPYTRNDGSYANLARTGCGIVSAAAVLNYYGIQVEPPELAAFAIAHKDHDSGGTKADFYTQIASKYNLKVKIEFGPNSATKGEIIQALQAGHPVIISGGLGSAFHTSAGHYIVLTGIRADGTINVNDSKRGSSFDGKSWPIDSLLSKSHKIIYLTQ